MVSRILQLIESSLVATVVLATCSLWLLPAAHAYDREEVLRYEVTWNGSKAGHGDVTTRTNSREVNVVVQAVSDGVLRTVLELWSRIQVTFLVQSFKPRTYNYVLKSNLMGTESVDLVFDHNTNQVKVNKQRGKENESHSETVRGAYDPITAAFLLRSQKDIRKPLFVDIYDGKDRARLYVNCGGSEQIQVKTGLHPAVKLSLRLVKLGGDKQEIAKGNLWISDDQKRVPLLLTSSPIVGTIRFELVQAQL
jgi:hypothetical protein